LTPPAGARKGLPYKVDAVPPANHPDELPLTTIPDRIGSTVQRRNRRFQLTIA